MKGVWSKLTDKEYGKRTKSGIMLGIGETADEVYQAMDDLVAHGLDVLTLDNTYSLPKCTWK
jgi:lipoic acid synthetase